MALSTNRVSAFASPGMAAAATARPASGGRNVASVGGGVEGAGFSPQIGVNDNRLWRYDDEQEFDFEGEQQQRRESATPFVNRAAGGFKVDQAEEAGDAGVGGRVFLGEVLRGIGVYEYNMRVTTPGAVRPGSVLNFRY